MTFIVMQIGVIALIGDTTPHSKFKSLQWIKILHARRNYKIKVKNLRAQGKGYQNLWPFPY